MTEHDTSTEQTAGRRVTGLPYAAGWSDETRAALAGPESARRLAWRNAYGIAWVGASNTAAVARTIAETISALRAAGTTWRDADRHVAVRAMVAHLAYLTGQGLGPTSEDLAMVRDQGVRLTLSEDTAERS